MSALDVFKQPFLLYPCIILAVWDTMTTGMGTLAILSNGTVGSIVATLAITAFVAAILLGSTVIVTGLNLEESPFVTLLLVFLIGLAVFYDLFTSFHGARYATIDVDQELGRRSTSFSEWLVIFLLTILSVLSSIICSWVFFGSKERSGV